MKIGMVGLGRMGGNMTIRLIRDGHEVIGFARSPENRAVVVKEGAEEATSLPEVVEKLEPPRTVWAMVPSGHATEQTIEELSRLMSEGDSIIDGGNSNYID